MRRLAFLCLMGAAVWADSGGAGIRPRRDATDYPVQATQDHLTVGAAVLPPVEVRHAFATDLNKGYVVVEVGVFPSGNAGPELRTTDFSLRAGASQTAIRPVEPQAVAASLTRGSSHKPDHQTPSSDINVYPTATIGYESGRVYDPVTGTTRRGGLYGGTGVIVTSGNPPGPAPSPQSTDRDRHTMTSELEDKALPEGAVTRPVAGYLYFPVTTEKKRQVAYELFYDGPSGRVRLPMPPVNGK